MSCCKLVLLGLLVSLGASIASGAAAPARELVVTAARFTDSSSWIDPDSALFGSGWLDPWLSPQAEMALLCYAPWFPPSQWHLLRHLPLVKTALIWYYPLSYGMGAWPLEAGDQLMCELYECDTGCNPNQPTALPTSADDFIGSATLLMADYRTSVYSQLSLSRNGTQSATVQLECDGCNALWASGSWVNPFQIPPANWSGSGSGAPVTLPEPSPPPASPAPASPPPATVPLLPAASPPAPAVVASPPPPAAILSPPPPPTPAAIPANSPAPTPALPPPAAMPAVPLFSPPLPRPPSPPPPTPTAIPANSPAPTPASPPPAAMPAVPLFSPPLPRPPSPRPPAPAPAPAPEISAFAGAPDGDAIGASSSPPPFASGPAAANLPPLRSDAPRPPSPSPTSPPAAPAGQVQPASVPEQQESAKGTPTALIAGLAAAGALVASLLLVALCAWRRWRRQRQAAQASEDAKSDSMQLEKGVNIPRIRAEKPQQAAAAMRSLQAPAAIVSTPWRPEQRG